jgi:hypothetical protein
MLTRRWRQRDRHIGRAYRKLHEAVGELRMAHSVAVEMGDMSFADDLWDYSEKILNTRVTAELSDHLGDQRPNVKLA